MAEYLLVGLVAVASLLIAWFSTRAAFRLYSAPVLKAPLSRVARGRH